MPLTWTEFWPIIDGQKITNEGINELKNNIDTVAESIPSINVVTTCPTAAATAGQVNIYTGTACATKYDNWLYFET